MPGQQGLSQGWGLPGRAELDSQSGLWGLSIGATVGGLLAEAGCQ